MRLRQFCREHSWAMAMSVHTSISPSAADNAMYAAKIMLTAKNVPRLFGYQAFMPGFIMVNKVLISTDHRPQAMEKCSTRIKSSHTPNVAEDFAKLHKWSPAINLH
jgi:hypothetical protein